jgi:hypothetical protein
MGFISAETSLTTLNRSALNQHEQRIIQLITSGQICAAADYAVIYGIQADRATIQLFSQAITRENPQLLTTASNKLHLQQTLELCVEPPLFR